MYEILSNIFKTKNQIISTAQYVSIFPQLLCMQKHEGLLNNCCFSLRREKSHLVPKKCMEDAKALALAKLQLFFAMKREISLCAEKECMNNAKAHLLAKLQLFLGHCGN